MKKSTHRTVKNYLRLFVWTLAATLPGLRHASAATVDYAFDQNNAAIRFVTRIAGALRPTGNFQRFQGNVAIDYANLGSTAITVQIDAASINMPLPGATSRLRSPDYFDTLNYPRISFQSTRVVVGTTGTVSIEGDMTLRNVVRPEIFTAMLMHETRDGQPIVHFEAMGHIKRSDFGMTAGRYFISDDIALAIQMDVPQAPADRK
jgi:polyisoprenoid-binding protein YceI